MYVTVISSVYCYFLLSVLTNTHDTSLQYFSNNRTAGKKGKKIFENFVVPLLEQQFI